MDEAFRSCLLRNVPLAAYDDTVVLYLYVDIGFSQARKFDVRGYEV